MKHWWHYQRAVKLQITMPFLLIHPTIHSPHIQMIERRESLVAKLMLDFMST